MVPFLAMPCGNDETTDESSSKGSMLKPDASMWCEVWSKQKVKWKVMMNV